MEFKFYEVGGKIRDEFLGLTSKDVDYSVVAEGVPDGTTPDEVFTEMMIDLTASGFKVFQQTPEAFTIRAMFPEWHTHSGVADFVLARKEIGYNTSSRMPEVAIGTLLYDLLC